MKTTAISFSRVRLCVFQYRDVHVERDTATCRLGTDRKKNRWPPKKQAGSKNLHGSMNLTDIQEILYREYT
jgi:hypothetical protein